MKKNRIAIIAISIIAILAVMGGLVACGATKLSKPTGLTVVATTDAGTFSWTAVKNADGYRVQIDGGSWSSKQSDTTYTLTGSALTVGSHTAKVKAIGDGKDYKDSDAASKTYAITVTPVAVKLTAPTSVELDEGVLTWGAVANASGYTVNAYRGATLIDSEQLGAQALEFDIADMELPAGTYTIKVLAKGDNVNYSNSDETAASGTYVVEGVVTLLAPANVTLVEGLLTWDEVDDADGYTVTVYDDQDAEVDADTVDNETFEYDLTAFNLPEGTYTITVKALGDGEDFLDSAEAAADELYEVIITIVIPQLDAPENVTLVGDLLTWDEVDDADGYTIIVYDDQDAEVCTAAVDGETFEYDLAELDLEAGTYTITVKALGNDEDFLDSDEAEADELYIVAALTPVEAAHKALARAGYTVGDITYGFFTYFTVAIPESDNLAVANLYWCADEAAAIALVADFGENSYFRYQYGNAVLRFARSVSDIPYNEPTHAQVKAVFETMGITVPSLPTGPADEARLLIAATAGYSNVADSVTEGANVGSGTTVVADTFTFSTETFAAITLYWCDDATDASTVGALTHNNYYFFSRGNVALRMGKGIQTEEAAQAAANAIFDLLGLQGEATPSPAEAAKALLDADGGYVTGEIGQNTYLTSGGNVEVDYFTVAVGTASTTLNWCASNVDAKKYYDFVAPALVKFIRGNVVLVGSIMGTQITQAQADAIFDALNLEVPTYTPAMAVKDLLANAGYMVGEEVFPSEDYVGVETFSAVLSIEGGMVMFTVFWCESASDATTVYNAISSTQTAFVCENIVLSATLTPFSQEQADDVFIALGLKDPPSPELTITDARALLAAAGYSITAISNDNQYVGSETYPARSFQVKGNGLPETAWGAGYAALLVFFEEVEAAEGFFMENTQPGWGCEGAVMGKIAFIVFDTYALNSIKALVAVLGFDPDDIDECVVVGVAKDALYYAKQALSTAGYYTSLQTEASPFGSGQAFSFKNKGIDSEMVPPYRNGGWVILHDSAAAAQSTFEYLAGDNSALVFVFDEVVILVLTGLGDGQALADACTAAGYDPHTADFTNVVIPTKLTAPVVTLTGDVLTWGAVSDADGYTVSVYNGSTLVDSDNVTVLTYDLSTFGLEVGVYTVKVVATGDGVNFVDSNAAEESYTVEAAEYTPAMEAADLLVTKGYTTGTVTRGNNTGTNYESFTISLSSQLISGTVYWCESTTDATTLLGKLSGTKYANANVVVVLSSATNATVLSDAVYVDLGIEFVTDHPLRVARVGLARAGYSVGANINSGNSYTNPVYPLRTITVSGHGLIGYTTLALLASEEDAEGYAMARINEGGCEVILYGRLVLTNDDFFRYAELEAALIAMGCDLDLDDYIIVALEEGVLSVAKDKANAAGYYPSAPRNSPYGGVLNSFSFSGHGVGYDWSDMDMNGGYFVVFNSNQEAKEAFDYIVGDDLAIVCVFGKVLIRVNNGCGDAEALIKACKAMGYQPSDADYANIPLPMSIAQARTKLNSAGYSVTNVTQQATYKTFTFSNSTTGGAITFFEFEDAADAEAYLLEEIANPAAQGFLLGEHIMLCYRPGMLPIYRAAVIALGLDPDDEAYSTNATDPIVAEYNIQQIMDDFKAALEAIGGFNNIAIATASVGGVAGALRAGISGASAGGASGANPIYIAAFTTDAEAITAYSALQSANRIYRKDNVLVYHGSTQALERIMAVLGHLGFDLGDATQTNID